MYKSILISLCSILILISAGCSPQTVSTPVAVPEGKRIIGYYPAWAAEDQGVFVANITAQRLTHVNYAFANVSPQGECILGDPAADIERVYEAKESVSGRADSKSAEFHGNFNQLLELKKQYPHLKVLISIGGWTWSENFSNAALTDEARQHFAASCVDLYLKQYGAVFDGLDIDWEYPVGGGMTPGRPEDKENFTLLLGEFRQQLDELGKTNNRHYLLTIAAPIGPGNIGNLQLEQIAQIVDWINLMTYDFHGAWDMTTNFNAPLFHSPNDPGDASLNIDSAVQRYLEENVPAEKLSLGVPFYGPGWAGVPNVNDGLYQSGSEAAPGTREAGSYTYADIKKNYLTDATRHWDAEAFVPWFYDPATGIFISYDDPQSLEAKAGYARDQGLGGVMIWDISQGDETLFDAIYAGLSAGGPPRPTPMPTVTAPRPFEATLHEVQGITVDGKLDDWTGEPTFTLDQQAQIVYNANPKSWKDAQDLSMLAWSGWTAEGLYFAFQVTDDLHKQITADTDLWHGDHVELQFDTELDKDYNNPGMNEDDYQIGISLGDFAKIPPVIYAWFNGPEAPGAITSGKLAFTQTDNGYVLEVFLPKEALAGIALEPGATFGMNVSVSDTDLADQETMLSTSAIRTYANPMTFGKITLAK
ncbi:MAG: hypothetical protein LC108_07885 [Anaerolineales bacterium]|nr:hypothetical protein [Anaerolineales bacterium]